MHLKALILKTSLGNANSALNITAMKSVLKLRLAMLVMILWQVKNKTRKANNSLCSRKNTAPHVFANTMMKEKNMQD